MLAKHKKNMTQHRHQTDLASVNVQASRFGQGDGAEYHIILTPTDTAATFEQQLSQLHNALTEYRHANMPASAHAVLRRYFVSDAANQHTMLLSALRGEEQCAVSIVQQPPLCGAKVALWVYLIDGIKTISADAYANLAVSHNGYTHYWTACNHSETGSSEDQTTHLLTDYEARLNANGISITDNCVRTWFFVRDVDVNYGGVVVGRRNNFDKVGLTNQTHYIASTGIEGRHHNYNVKVVLDAYAIDGLQPGQMSYLYAPSHLNPTYEYGVTFERGTCVEYADRKELYISGTASIDNKGNVMHIGDIRRQTHRMWENVEALLAEREATMDDVAQITVYLRDTADYAVVQQMFAERFPHTPHVIVLAPVCRPSWLIEMECIAVTPNSNEAYRAF